MNLLSIVYKSFDCKIKCFFIHESLLDLLLIKKKISHNENVPVKAFNLSIDGKTCVNNLQLFNGIKNKCIWLNAYIPIVGGKGGFGSMLRAIGAQIEKTTNKEACRDLSGRRLRDINAENRLKAWIAKQGQEKEEKAKKKREKLEKLKQEPKIMFEDIKYFQNKEELSENVNEALETGLKKLNSENNKKTETEKRKSIFASPSNSKKPKKDLWLGLDDLEEELEEDASSEFEDDNSSKLKINPDDESKKELKSCESLDINQETIS